MLKYQHKGTSAVAEAPKWVEEQYRHSELAWMLLPTTGLHYPMNLGRQR